MNHARADAQLWRRTFLLLPWLVLLGCYLQWGWLDFEQGLGLDPIEPMATPLPTAAARVRPAVRAAPPWPDEPALRRLLTQWGLRSVDMKWGPQRSGQTEVRLMWVWQGRARDALGLLATLALDWPQLQPDSLGLSALAMGDWQVEWRGRWTDLQAPRLWPERWQPDGVQTLARPWLWMDPVPLRGRQQWLWEGRVRTDDLMRQWRPEQLQLVAVVRGTPMQAWVIWQRRVWPLRVGDRIGALGGVVRVIEPDHVQIEEQGRVHQVRVWSPTLQEKP